MKELSQEERARGMQADAAQETAPEAQPEAAENGDTMSEAQPEVPENGDAMSEEAAAADAALAVMPGEDEESEPEPAFVPRKGFRYGCYRFVKRTFDIISSGLMLILLSWLILLCILIKWLEDFHNPIYVSKRVGKNGKIFRFYKIRTMCPNAEEMKQKLIEAGLNEADPPAFKMKNDPRITKVGKVFRKLSLDELPQLFNIFNGSMSVVGPPPPHPPAVGP